MVTKEQINRINWLARKAKQQGLNGDEKEEQQELRALYLASIRENVISQLSQIQFTDQGTVQIEEMDKVDEIEVICSEKEEEAKQ